jgi:benzoate-CoA ligase family protein
MSSRPFNMARYFLDSNLEAGRGDKTAVRWKNGAWTYREAVAQANRAGRVLRDLGVRPGERVHLTLPDGPELVAAFFGALRIGAVATLGSPYLDANDLADAINYTDARVAVTLPDTAERIESARFRCKGLRHILVVGRDYGDLLARASSDPVWAETTEDDVAIWLWSGGTTGRSKAVVHRHRDFVYCYEKYARQVLRLTESDSTLAGPKLFLAYATGLNLLFPLGAGGTVCLFPERATADSIFENLRRFKPTLLVNVPTLADAMVRHPAAKAQDLSGLRLSTSAMEPLPESLYRKWKETFGVELLNSMGSVEMAHTYLSQRPGDVRPDRVGRPVDGYEVELRDENDAPVAAGEMGRLWVKGGSSGVAYFGEPERTAETFRGDWVKTADLFRADAEGFLDYAGRADDLFKVGGLFVSPLEIEDVLQRHPAVADAAACGYTDEGGLVKACALILPRPGVEATDALAAEIQDFAKRSLAPHKSPRRIHFVDGLPRTERGKLDRRRLPELIS